MSQQRSSPFRRAGSPSSPTAYRASTPPSTARAQASPLSSPSKLKHSYTASEEEEDELDESLIVTPTKVRSQTGTPQFRRSQDMTNMPVSPVRKLPEPPVTSHRTTTTSSPARTTLPNMGDDISRLPPALLHSLRESFSVLDSNSTGTINAAMVAETLQSLGLSTNEMSQLFPHGQHQQITLPQYLNSMASALAAMSPPQELLNAFSAFDDDDSGQVDVVQLKKALVTTPPEPGVRDLSERDIDDALRGHTGRRILGKSGTGLSGLRSHGASATNKTGEVFRYREFCSNLSGASDQVQHPASMAAR